MMNAMESPKYHDLRADPGAKNPIEDTESLTDYEDDDDKAWSDDAMQDGSMARRRRTREKRVRSAVVSFRSILDTGLLLVILGLVIDRRRQSGDGKSLFEVAGDVTGFAPRCKSKCPKGVLEPQLTMVMPVSQQITKFSPDPSFVPHNMSEMFTESVRERWLSIVPSMNPPPGLVPAHG